MVYRHFRYARRIDADTLGIYQADLTKIVELDSGTANVRKIIGGGGTAGDDLQIKANTVDTYPSLSMQGDGNVILELTSNKIFYLYYGGSPIFQFKPAGVMHFKETTTPTAVADFGAIYTKNDNELYFQTGAGVEKTVTTL